MDRPNVLLILCDEMRGDCLGIAGHPDVKTPWLDTLASYGVRYPNAFSSCPTCIPARAAIHTGMSQEHHGRVGYQDGVAWRYPHTLAGEFTAAGYQTACVGKMHVHPLRNTLGYEQVELHDGYLHYYRRPDTPGYEDQRLADDYFYWLKEQLGPAADVTDSGLDCNAWVARPWPYEERLHPTHWVTDRSLDFFRRRDRNKPFFLTVSYVRPHAPYDPPQVYWDMYKDQTFSTVSVGDWADAPAAGRIANSESAPSDPELLRQARIGYYGCITQLDHEIGRLYMSLLEQQLLSNTVILFASDHGEMLGDHHFTRKSLPYQGSIQVPMILCGPTVFGREGTVDPRIVELRDIMPTLLSSAGAPVPDSVDGVDIVNGPKRTYLHGEHLRGDLSHHFIVTQKDKYIWFSVTGKEQYFDLESDPRELHDRIQDPAVQDRILELRALMTECLKDREEGFVEVRNEAPQLIPGRPLVSILKNSRI